MEIGDVQPDVYTYSSLVGAYARLGDVEAAVKTLTDMTKRGVKPNRFTLSSVMQVNCGNTWQGPESIYIHMSACDRKKLGGWRDASSHSSSG